MGPLMTVSGVLHRPDGYDFLLELSDGSIWMLDMPWLMGSELASMVNRHIMIVASQIELGMLMIQRLVFVGDKVDPRSD